MPLKLGNMHDYWYSRNDMVKNANEKADELKNNINSIVQNMQQTCNTLKRQQLWTLLLNDKIKESCKEIEFYSMQMNASKELFLKEVIRTQKDVDMFGADTSFNCDENDTGDDSSMDHSMMWKLLKDTEESLRTVESKVRFLAGMQWSVTSASDEIANELDKLEEFKN